MVYKVYQYFKLESQQADTAMCNTGGGVARCQEQTASAYYIGLWTV